MLLFRIMKYCIQHKVLDLYSPPDNLTCDFCLSSLFCMSPRCSCNHREEGSGASVSVSKTKLKALYVGVNGI